MQPNPPLLAATKLVGAPDCAAQAPQAHGVTLCHSAVLVNEYIEASDWTGCLGAVF